ncbi:polysaccharide biosynthesis protein [Prevotella sp. HUN102]|uniref:polysaccharide biosynthesis protein n=1 Tax=Prevotella sp. HUN102 TaxID=1392486 RepID=UPI000A70EEB1|nr:polysaccharide biosynthesis protein [Prevotella sp. HUN102]
MRIAKNTTLMFFRMLLLTIINLYTVRLVLKGLGFIDYGIFNAVAGVVTSAGFISGVLALSIQRFFSIALGQGDNKRLNNIFSASMNIIFVLCIATIILFETIGLWFVSTQMTIPPERLTTTLCLYHCSIFVFIFSLLQIPFTAAIFSNENMGVYAVLSTIDSLLRLLLAAIITIVDTDHLAFYGFGLLAEAGIILGMYAWRGMKYKECHYTKTNDKILYRQLLKFSGWTMFGSLASMGMNQGNTILINVFFGPISNMAFGIAMQISNAFNALSNSMVLSFRPAMIKAYAKDDFQYIHQLFNISNKFLYYTLLCIGLPILIEMETILKLWLGNANSETVLFARLMIIFISLLALNNPITIIIEATGKVKEYHIVVESITLLSLPITWILYKSGSPSYAVFLVMLSICIIAHIARLWCLKRTFKPFAYSQYSIGFAFPAILITALSAMTAVVFQQITTAILHFVLMFLLLPIVAIGLSFILGLNKTERAMLLHLYHKKKA